MTTPGPAGKAPTVNRTLTAGTRGAIDKDMTRTQKDKTMTKTYRACYWLSDDRQSDVVLTREKHSDRSDAMLVALALIESVKAGLDLSGGTLEIGEWTEQ